MTKNGGVTFRSGDTERQIRNTLIWRYEQKYIHQSEEMRAIGIVYNVRKRDERLNPEVGGGGRNYGR